MEEIEKKVQLDWRKFLASESGIKGMLILRESIPSVNKGLPHEIQYDGAYAEGFKKCLDTISLMLGAQPKKPESLENTPELLR